MNSAVVGDTWYLMGGLGDVITDQVYSASLLFLIYHVNNTRENMEHSIFSRANLLRSSLYGRITASSWWEEDTVT